MSNIRRHPRLCRRAAQGGSERPRLFADRRDRVAPQAHGPADLPGAGRGPALLGHQESGGSVYTATTHHHGPMARPGPVRPPGGGMGLPGYGAGHRRDRKPARDPQELRPRPTRVVEKAGPRSHPDTPGHTDASSGGAGNKGAPEQERTGTATAETGARAADGARAARGGAGRARRMARGLREERAVSAVRSQQCPPRPGVCEETGEARASAELEKDPCRLGRARPTPRPGEGGRGRHGGRSGGAAKTPEFELAKLWPATSTGAGRQVRRDSHFLLL